MPSACESNAVGTLQVKNVPERALDELRRRAVQAGLATSARANCPRDCPPKQPLELHERMTLVVDASAIVAPGPAPTLSS